MATKLVSSAITVTTAGTRVRCAAASTKVRDVWVQPDDANTGRTFLGGSTVAAALGIVLEVAASGLYPRQWEWHAHGAGDYLDLYELWVDSAVNGEKVQILYRV